jgi:hypothetical protein
MSAVVVFGE